MTLYLDRAITERFKGGTLTKSEQVILPPPTVGWMLRGELQQTMRYLGPQVTKAKIYFTVFGQMFTRGGT